MQNINFAKYAQNPVYEKLYFYNPLLKDDLPIFYSRFSVKIIFKKYK